MKISLTVDGKEVYRYMSNTIPRTGEVIWRLNTPKFRFEVEVVEHIVQDLPVMNESVNCICKQII